MNWIMEDEYRRLLATKVRLEQHRKALCEMDLSTVLSTSEDQVRRDIRCRYLQSEIERLQSLYPTLLNKYVFHHGDELPTEGKE